MAHLRNASNYWFYPAAVTLFLVVALRAILVAPYMDEIFTFFTYIESGSFQPGYAHIDANNHLLNSFLAHVSFLAFGDEMWSIRLPNVLSFLLYLFAVNKIRLSFNDTLMGNAFALCMLSSMYLLSFFSLSRGYGISLALLTYSCYCFINLTYKPTTRSVYHGIGALILASAANLTLLPIALLFSVLFLYHFVRLIKKSSLMVRIVQCTILLIFTGLSYSYLYHFSLELKVSGLLYHGQQSGYLNALFFELPNELMQTSFGAEWVFIGIVALSAFGLFKRLRKQQFTSAACSFSLLALIALALPLLVNDVMAIPFPQGRTGMHYFVLLLLPAFLNLQESKSLLSRISAWGLSGVMVISFLLQVQMSYAPCWRDDTIPTDILTIIHASGQENEWPPTVAAHGILGKALQHQGYLNETPTPFRELYEATYYEDFILTNRWHVLDNAGGYDTIWHQPVTTVTLLKRNSTIQFNTLVDTCFTTISCSEEFQGLIQAPLQEKTDSPLQLIVHLESEGLIPPFNLHLIAQVKDENNQVLTKGELEIQKLSRNAQGILDIHAAVTLSAPTRAGSEVEIYLWNPKSQPHQLDKLHIILREIKDKESD